MKLSHLSETLIGSEIVKLGGEIRERIRNGEKIYNFTVGDFDPKVFPIPAPLEQCIINAYEHHYTNYPPAEGSLELRETISQFCKEHQGLNYSPSEILVASGGRPLIYALFRTIVDKGEKVIYAVPSWNNNHYTHFVDAEHVVIEAKAENNFMLTAQDLKPHIHDATFIALCSPQNPTGTTFRKEELQAICNMVVEENKRRGDAKKIYVMYDQMYWHLTYGNIVHYDPVSLNAEIRPYTVYIDAISKVFAATGVRVGWCMGPAPLLNKMKAILSHVGAWAPMPEQKGLAHFLSQKQAIRDYLTHFKSELSERLTRIYNGLQELKKEGFNVDAVAPEAAIYLTIKIDLAGSKLQNGEVLKTQEDVTAFLIKYARLAVVPFHAFGASGNVPWYRLSVGTCKKEEIEEMLLALRTALQQLQH